LLPKNILPAFQNKISKYLTFRSCVKGFVETSCVITDTHWKYPCITYKLTQKQKNCIQVNLIWRNNKIEASQRRK